MRGEGRLRSSGGGGSGGNAGREMCKVGVQHGDLYCNNREPSASLRLVGGKDEQWEGSIERNKSSYVNLLVCIKKGKI